MRAFIVAALGAVLAVVFLLPVIPDQYGLYTISGMFLWWFPGAYVFQGAYGFCAYGYDCYTLATFSSFTQLDYAAIAVLGLALGMMTWRRTFLAQNKMFMAFYASASIVASALLTFSFSVTILGVLALPMIPYLVKHKHYMFAALPIAVLAGPFVIGTIGGGFAGLVLGGILQGFSFFILVILTPVSFSYGAYVLALRAKNVPTLAAPKIAPAAGTGSTLEEEEKEA